MKRTKTTSIELYSDRKIKLILERNQYFELAIIIKVALHFVLLLFPLLAYSGLEMFSRTSKQLLDFSIYIIIPIFIFMLNILWIYDYLYFLITKKSTYQIIIDVKKVTTELFIVKFFKKANEKCSLPERIKPMEFLFFYKQKEDWNIKNIRLVDTSNYCVQINDRAIFPISIHPRLKNLFNYFREPTELHFIYNHLFYY